MFGKFNFIFLLLWAIPLGILLGLVMGPHFAAHKKETITGLTNSLNNDFIVHHFLSMECNCSNNIIKHLINRKANSNTQEFVQLIHADESVIKKLTRTGYHVFPLTEEEAVRVYNVQVIPQLAVIRGKNIIYQGGYARDQQHTEAFEDEKIIHALQSNGKVAEFPILGCANGTLMKSKLDILGVKYQKLEGNKNDK